MAEKPFLQKNLMFSSSNSSVKFLAKFHSDFMTLARPSQGAPRDFATLFFFGMAPRLLLHRNTTLTECTTKLWEVGAYSCARCASQCSAHAFSEPSTPWRNN